jgi:hypothetical protein
LENTRITGVKRGKARGKHNGVCRAQKSHWEGGKYAEGRQDGGFWFDTNKPAVSPDRGPRTASNKRKRREGTAGTQQAVTAALISCFAIRHGAQARRRRR